MTAADIGVIIVAAGTGSRAGSHEPKQFRWIAGKPMLLHSIQTFHQRADVAMVVCVLPRDKAADPPPWVFQCDLERLLISVGGEERIDSVRNGLEDIPEELPYILVHDAARPITPMPMIDRVVTEMRRGTAVVPCLPVHDTIKQVDENNRVVGTLNRSRIIRVQTPQGFPREQLVQAHTWGSRERRATFTDDAALCEAAGIEVVAVAGSELAMKITSEADFGVLEALYNAAS